MLLKVIRMVKVVFHNQTCASLFLFALAFVPRVLGLDVFLTVDESAWAGLYVKPFLMAILRRDFAATYLEFHPGVTNLWFASASLLARYLVQSWNEAGGMKMALAGFQQFLKIMKVEPLDFAFVPAQRVPFVLLTSASVIPFYLLVKKLFNGRIAFLSAAMWTFDPLHLAYSRLVLPDILVTVFMALSLLSFIAYLRDTPIRGYLVFSSLMAGLAFLTKTVSLVLVPTVCLTTAVTYFSQTRQRGESQRKAGLYLALALVLWGGLAALTFIIFWPAMWVAPIKTLTRMIRDVAGWGISPWHRHNFFWGRVTATADPGPFFYPVALLLRITPLTLGGIVALLFSFVKFGREKEWPLRKLKMEIGVLGSYVVLFVVLISFSALKQGDRYLLPIFPVLEVLGAVGLYTLAEAVVHTLRSGSLVKSRVWFAASLTVLLVQAGFSLPCYPYYLSCYNPLVGGGARASEVIMLGIGEGLDEAARYLSKKGNAEDLRVLAWYNAQVFDSLFAGQSWGLSRQAVFWNDIGYVVFYINQVQRQFPDLEMVRFFRSLEPEHIVRINGVNYAWIYKMPKPIPNSFHPYQHFQPVQFGDKILFRGYDLYDETIREDGKLRITLYWQALRSMEEDYTIYLKLINGAYHVWGQQDDRPYWGGLPTNSWKEGQVVGDKREIEILPGTPAGSYQVEVIPYDLHSGEVLEPSGGSQLLLGPVVVPRRQPPDIASLAIDHQTEVELSGKVRLLGYNIESGFRPGDGIHLTLFWQCLAEMDQDYTVFTHLIDEKQNIWGQKDNQPVDGFHPTSQWEAGEIVRDQYDILISSEAPPGEYQIKVGMYLAETGERLAVSKDGVPLPDSWILLQPVAVGGME